MSNNLVGKTVKHEGKLYQILSEKETLLLAASYGDDCGIEETIFVSKKTGTVVAKKSSYSKIKIGDS